MKAKIIPVFIIFLALGASGFMIYNTIIKSNNSELNVSDGIQNSNKVVKEFIKDKQASSVKYFHKKINIKGKVKTTNKGYVILENNVICHMENNKKAVVAGDEVVIKGEVDSYDDLMEEIKLEHCYVVN